MPPIPSTAMATQTSHPGSEPGACAIPTGSSITAPAIVEPVTSTIGSRSSTWVCA
jgi:hypothetical protein